ncbi:hypothetical protein [Nonomuraea sp. NPDC005650]|uniref:hypothetical protein n=1 Tax=Nonomuraea sp. NPDC005650 TaxID=3157045 RepID=UPI0033B44B36
MAVELVDEAAQVEGLAENPAGEQPARRGKPVEDHEAGWWLSGQFAEEGAEPRWQMHEVTAGGQVGVAVLVDDLACGEMADPLDLEPEQRDKSPGGADADRQAVVGEAALEEPPPLVASRNSAGSWRGMTRSKRRWLRPRSAVRLRK